MEFKRKIIVILGPTASGKSELAVKIALQLSSGQTKKKFGTKGGEVISADSRQVYKGLDIGSGKVPGTWVSEKADSASRLYLKRNNDPTASPRGAESTFSGHSNIFVYKKVPHHCIDFVPPKKIFTVIDFKKCADKAIEEIFAKGKTPIIVGGTGLYIDAVVKGQTLPEVKPNWELRKRLEEKTAEEMFEILKKLDPERAKNIDPKNPRRLIRAIEIASKLGKVPSLNQKSIINNQEVMQIGVKLPDEMLKKNIEKRIKKMLRDGLVAETKKLKDSGLSWKRIYELGFEYKYPAMFLQGKIERDEMLTKMLTENWRYAKRQMTWFKRDKEIRWVESAKEAEKLVKEILKS